MPLGSWALRHEPQDTLLSPTPHLEFVQAHLMGVSELWALLKSVGNVQYLSGSEGTHTAVVREVQARAVAVDLSAWVVQAICQPDLAQAFNDPDSQALSVSFNRVSAGTR